MTRPRSLVLVLVLVLVATPTLAAPGEGAPAEVRGALSFVADRSVYVSLGSEAGLAPGDEAVVVRAGRRIAVLEIGAVSSRSAVASPVTIEVPLRAGDIVLVRLRRIAPAPAPAAAPEPGAGPAPDDLEELWIRVEAAPPQKVPFRRGGAEVPPPGTGTGAGASPGGAGSRPAASLIRGSITLGYAGSFDSGKDAPQRSYHAPRGSAALTVERIGGANLALRFRGDARGIISSEDLRDRSGAQLDRRIYLTELSLTYEPEAAPLRVSIGRTFAADAAQAGLVDGGRAGALVGPLEIGGFGGLDAAPDLSDRGRLKYGGYATLRTPVAAALAYQAGLAFVRTTEAGAVDRQLVALDQRLVLAPYLTAFNLVEVDIYSGTDNPRDRPDLDLTDIYAGVRARPAAFLDLGLSYDRRRAFFGARELDDLFPAALAFVDDASWQTLRADARVGLPLALYVRGFGDRRLGAGDGLALGGEVGCDSIAGSTARAGAGLASTRTRYLDGVSGFGRAGALLLDRLDATLTYTVSSDDYGDGGDRVVRHEPRLSLEVLFSRAVSAYLEAAYEAGDEARRAMLAAAVTFRF